VQQDVWPIARFSRFGAGVPRRRLKHGVFHSGVDLQAAIIRFIREHNATDPKPFTWNVDPDHLIIARTKGLKC
jgi:hypothetical protein